MEIASKPTAATPQTQPAQASLPIERRTPAKPPQASDQVTVSPRARALADEAESQAAKQAEAGSAKEQERQAPQRAAARQQAQSLQAQQKIDKVV